MSLETVAGNWSAITDECQMWTKPSVVLQTKTVTLNFDLVTNRFSFRRRSGALSDRETRVTEAKAEGEMWAPRRRHWNGKYESEVKWFRMIRTGFRKEKDQDECEEWDRRRPFANEKGKNDTLWPAKQAENGSIVEFDVWLKKESQTKGRQWSHMKLAIQQQLLDRVALIGPRRRHNIGEWSTNNGPTTTHTHTHANGPDQQQSNKSQIKRINLIEKIKVCVCVCACPFKICFDTFCAIFCEIDRVKTNDEKMARLDVNVCAAYETNRLNRLWHLMIC